MGPRNYIDQYYLCMERIVHKDLTEEEFRREVVRAEALWLAYCRYRAMTVGGCT